MEQTMKRIAYFSLAVIVLLGAFLALAAAQSDSLADSARAARKDKKETSKKFDNDNRLRNQGAWDKEDAQYKKQLDAKQKELATAKQELDDLKEQARKAGVPAGLRE